MRVIILILILSSSISLYSQEVLSDLISNPALESNKFVSNKNKNALALPFFDDFSYRSPVADTNLWQVSSVFFFKLKWNSKCDRG